jgi:hypothetical protein
VLVTYSTKGTIEERLARLEQRVQELSITQSKIAVDLQREITDRKEANQELREYVRVEVARLDHTLAEQQRATEEVDARALPVILFGALLSTFPDLLALSPWVGTFAVMIGCGWMVRAYYLIISARPTSPLTS